MEKLTVTNATNSLTLLDDGLHYQVMQDGYEWLNQGTDPYVVFQRNCCGYHVRHRVLFTSAKSISHRVENNSIISTYSGFNIFGKKLSTVLTATATLLDEGKVDFRLSASEEQGVYFKACYYPAAFNAAKYDKTKAYTVDPMRQGFILPDTYEVNRKAIDDLTKHCRQINTGEAYLPIWGRVCGDKGYSAVLDDCYDATLASCYGADNAMLTSVCWIGSLGKLSYDRVAHLRFYDNCSYVTIAKDFRRQEIAQGKFVSIDEKIKKNPNVAKLIGTPVIHWNMLEHNVKTSLIYKQCKVLDKVHNTFDGTIEKFKNFKAQGLDKAYIHIDGWGKRGYDNLHPYILPPSDKIGGMDGMKRLSDACGEIGYLFGLHDQYRDYYQDSPVYDKNKCVVDVNGKRSYCDIWAGGAHNWLCSKFAKECVKRTYDELAENNINVDGTYLDVFSIMWGDECYDPAHPMTRKQSMEARGECFDMLRERGLIMSSEELGCELASKLDLVHHAPYAVTPQGRGVGVGISVPLTNLVYHDSVFVPWCCEGKGGWGIPDGDSGRMHCILNGQTPYFNNAMREDDPEIDKQDITEHIKQIKEVADINALVYNAELVNHEFVDGNVRVQRNTFSNGVKITVDFDKDTYSIEK